MVAQSDSTSHSPGMPTVPGAEEGQASVEAGGEVVLMVGEGEEVLMVEEGEVVVAVAVAIAAAVEVEPEAECGLAPLLLLKVEKLRSNVVLRLRPHLQFLRYNIFQQRRLLRLYKWKIRVLRTYGPLQRGRGPSTPLNPTCPVLPPF